MNILGLNNKITIVKDTGINRELQIIFCLKCVQLVLLINSGYFTFWSCN